MKVNDSVANVAALGVDKSGVEKVNATRAESGAKQKTENSKSGIKTTENVTLSPLSAKLQSLEAKVAASSVFDTEKVDAIKSAIATGQFQVSSEKVANGLVETVKDLLTSRSA